MSIFSLAIKSGRENIQSKSLKAQSGKKKKQKKNKQIFPLKLEKATLLIMFFFY